MILCETVCNCGVKDHVVPVQSLMVQSGAVIKQSLQTSTDMFHSESTEFGVWTVRRTRHRVCSRPPGEMASGGAWCVEFDAFDALRYMDLMALIGPHWPSIP